MPLAELVEVDGINTSVEIVVRALEGPVIRGTTIGADDKPVACLITASHVTSSWETTTRSNDDGSFEMGPLPDGEFILIAVEQGDRGADSDPTKFSAGSSGVELRLMPACAVTVVIAPRGGKQLDADLVFSGSNDAFGPTSCSTENGVRTLTGLREGSLTVWAETSCGLCAVRSGIELRAGPTPTEVELRLEPGAKLVLRYEGPLDWEEYGVFSDGARIDFGSYWLGNGIPMLVPAGSIEVRKVPRDGRPPETHRVTLAAGEERELVVGK